MLPVPLLGAESLPPRPSLFFDANKEIPFARGEHGLELRACLQAQTLAFWCVPVARISETVEQKESYCEVA